MLAGAWEKQISLSGRQREKRRREAQAAADEGRWESEEFKSLVARQNQWKSRFIKVNAFEGRVTWGVGVRCEWVRGSGFERRGREVGFGLRVSATWAFLITVDGLAQSPTSPLCY